ncbi:hypothetical protein C2R54_08005 [Helicobacter pylori]|nr:hypothetical protein C2R54_08005 [Helicobacter pylori]
MKAFLFYNTKVRSNGILKKKEIPWLYIKKSIARSKIPNKTPKKRYYQVYFSICLCHNYNKF